MAANNIYIQVDFNSQQAQQNVNALNQAIASTGPAADKSGKQATTSLGQVNIAVKQTTQAFGEMTAALAGLGIGRIVASMVQIGAELGRAQTMMVAFTGSAEEASKVFEEIRAIAAQSPFRFKDLEETGRTLLAFGVAAKDVPNYLRAISDQVTAMGGSIEQVNSIVRIFGRVISKDFVGAMDLMRLLPQQGVPVMNALRKAVAEARGEVSATRGDVEKAIKEGALDPTQTLRVIVDAMQQKTGGAGARLNDAAKAFKNLGDQIIYAVGQLAGPSGFGPALTNLAREIQQMLAPLAALLKWLMDLPEPTKEMIVNIAAATAAVVAFAGAWKLFTGVSGPAIEAIYAIGKALKTAIFALMANPEILAWLAGITAAVGLYAQMFPEQAKKVEKTVGDWVGGLWGSLKAKIAELAKESGLFGDLFKTPEDAKAKAKQSILVETEDNLKAVQAQVAEWADSASKTVLQALSSPAEAVAIKYKDLFDKLNQMLRDKAITPEHGDQLRTQLATAQAMESESKLFEKKKQDIAEQTKLDVERVKGSYEAQIAYIEAMDEQDLRKKVAAIDRITQLRVDQAQSVARVEEDELQQVFEAQRTFFEKYRATFEQAGIDVDAAIADRRAEMEAKRAVIEQKGFDETQKYRLEGWKKANDAIIEDQQRVYEAFKSEFDQLFDVFTNKSKSIGAALGDFFKNMVLGEAKNLFSSQAAAFATEAAGYGAPTEKITRGGGILSMLFQRGMPPRPPGPPPDAYNPERNSSAFKPLETSANSFSVGVDAYNQATIRFALAVGQFTSGGGSSQGEANRSADDAGPLQQASQATGVSESLLRAVAQVESGMRPNAVSPKGAAGLMQLMPGTARDLGVADVFDAQQNATGGAKYLGQLLNRYGGDVGAALAAYNMGPAAYDRAVDRGRALPTETQNYVRRVMGLMGQGGADESPGFAQATHDLPLPPGFSVQGGQLVYQTPTQTAMMGDISMPPESGGSVTTGAVPPAIRQAAQAGSLQKVAALAAGTLGAPGGGGSSGGLKTLLNPAKLKDLFGIGQASGGGTSLGSVLGSKGVANLATMIGLGIVSKGLEKRSTLGILGGSAMVGFGMAKTLGMTGYGGAITGIGAGLVAAGLQRGGLSGFGMDIAGGAIVGMQFGGPLGAAIGAAVGAIAGGIRMFVQTEQERIRQQIKQVYGIDISNRQILSQIQQIIDQKYGGSVSIGVRSQEVQDIIRLYALSTGQAAMLPRPMYAATIAQSTGGLALQPVYQGGVLVQNPYTGPTTYQYQTAVTQAQGLMAGTSQGVPGASGLVLQTIQGNPAAIAMANRAAVSAGDSRLTTTRAMQEPLTALG